MDSKGLAELAAEACDDRKAHDIQLIRVDEVTSITDWILITEGFSDVQVKAIIKSVEDKIKSKADLIPLRKEGVNEGKWALLDYGDLIVHVLQSSQRKYYDLESFWGHGRKQIYTSNQNQTKNIL